MLGIIASVVAFSIAFIFNSTPAETVIRNSGGSPF
jgi:hypothetical protein